MDISDEDSIGDVLLLCDNSIQYGEDLEPKIPKVRDCRPTLTEEVAAGVLEFRCYFQDDDEERDFERQGGGDSSANLFGNFG